MDVLNISLEEFNNLKPLELDNHVFSSESMMYILSEKNEIYKQRMLLKKLNNNFGTVFSNKLFTVNELIGKKEIIGIDEFVFPDRLIAVDDNVVGFSIPYINNIDFQTLLYSNEFSNGQKIEYFKQIGKILEEMRIVRECTDLKDFYLNDIHENNFILNKDTNSINVIDLDSCKINHNLTFAARYLSGFAPMGSVKKYKFNDEPISVGGYYLIDQNTELYCYIVMLLNYLTGTKMTILNIDEFYSYLYYLHSIGVSHELVDKLALIYTERDNENPYEYLDEFVNIVDECRYGVYKVKMLKKK